MFRSFVFRGIVAAVFGTTAAMSSLAAQPQKQDSAPDKHLDIQSSAGDLHVGNDADARKAGLPLYPGARVRRDEENSTAANLSLFTDAFGVTITKAAPTSYAGCVGGDESDTAGPDGLGIFYRNSKVRLTDIRDGTSQTILIGEKAWSVTNGTWVGAVNNGVTVRGTQNLCPGNATASSSTLGSGMVVVVTARVRIGASAGFVLL